MEPQKVAILTALRKNGQRITRTRVALISILVKISKPVSAFELNSLLQKHQIQVNKTTIYRELAFLLSEKVIQKVHLSMSADMYELADLPHHHHVVCTGCGNIEDVVFSHEAQLLSEIQKQTTLKIHDHALEFYGQCQNCL